MALEQKLIQKLAETHVVSQPQEELAETRPMDIVPTFAISIYEAKERIAMLQEFVKHMMVPGQDYGLIPGCNKPSLLKPGAEKLCEIFGFAKQVEIINRMEDWQQPFLHYEVKVALTNKRTGLVEAEGIGSCNSKEKKYATQNTFTIANTLIKMAKKRALVDAVLSATRSSSLFTQDVEDMDIHQPTTNSTQLSTAHSKNQATTSKPKPSALATKLQVAKISTLIVGMEPEAVKQLLVGNFQVNTIQELTKAQASTLIQKLMQK